MVRKATPLSKKPGGKAKEKLSKKSSPNEVETTRKGAGAKAKEVVTVEVDWTEARLWKLVNAIGDNEDIKAGLFPESGGNKSLSKGGSKTKIEYQWALAYHVFQGDEEFKDIIEEAKDEPVDRRAWALKVKNRLQRLVSEVRDIISEMGQTGAGLTSAEQVDTSLNSVVTTVWTRVKEKTPWFWTVKSFIAKRPNLVPTGVGNNSTGYDVSILQPGKGDNSETGSGDDGGGDEDQDGLGEASLGLEEEFEGQSASVLIDDWSQSNPPSRSGIDDEDAESKGVVADEKLDDGVDGLGYEEDLAVGEKRQRSGADFDRSEKKFKVEAKKLTTPRTGKSTPATTTSAPKKARTGIEKLSDIAVKEEETTQRIIELKRAKAEGVANKEIAKVKFKAEIEMNRDKLKANLASQKLEHDFKLKQMEWEYKLKMALSQQHQLSTAGPSASFPSSEQQNTFSSGVNQWAVSNPSSSNAPLPEPSEHRDQSHSSSAKPQSLTEELNSDTFTFGDVNYYQ